ncbi:MAG: biopolymer transporter ExbD [Sphingomonas bacterium]|nr:biopolymer transporter ExbD [Sphingomonas bacterium]
MRRYYISNKEVMMAIALREPQPMLEMNMTPLIDVLLVLITMFIITVPIQTDAVKIDLPQNSPTPIKPNAVRNVLTIAPDGTARWNGVVADDATLRATLRASAVMQPQPELHLRPDAMARYERVDAVLAMTKRAEIIRMGFVGNEAYRRF